MRYASWRISSTTSLYLVQSLSINAIAVKSPHKLMRIFVHILERLEMWASCALMLTARSSNFPETHSFEIKNGLNAAGPSSLSINCHTESDESIIKTNWSCLQFIFRILTFWQEMWRLVQETSPLIQQRPVTGSAAPSRQTSQLPRSILKNRFRQRF